MKQDDGSLTLFRGRYLRGVEEGEEFSIKLGTKKCVCLACIGDEYLSAEITKDGASGVCSYCGKRGRGISIEDLAEHVEDAFERHYRRTSPDPDDVEYMLLRDREANFEFYRHGEPVISVIAEAAEIDEAIAADVQKILEERNADFEMAKMGEECEFAQDFHYEPEKANDSELQLPLRD